MTHNETDRIEINGEVYQRLPDECVQIVGAIAAEHNLPVDDVLLLFWKQFMTPRNPGESDEDWITRWDACKVEMPYIYSRGDVTVH